MTPEEKQKVLAALAGDESALEEAKGITPDDPELLLALVKRSQIVRPRYSSDIQDESPADVEIDIPTRAVKSPLFLELERIKAEATLRQAAAAQDEAQRVAMARRNFPGFSISQGLSFERMPRPTKRRYRA